MGLDVRFSIYFHGPCVFPHIKTVHVRLCHRVMDCIVLYSEEEKGGMVERREERSRERMSEGEGGSGVVLCSSEGHGSLALAKKTVVNTCSCLQRPFNLLITCQSITRQPDQMSAAARTRTGRGVREEGGRESKERKKGKWGTDCMSGRAENEGESKWSSCVCISKIC